MSAAVAWHQQTEQSTYHYTAWCSCSYSIFQIEHAVYSEVGIQKLYNCGVPFCHALESPLLIFSPLLLSLTDLLFDVPHNRITIQLITFLHLEVHHFSKLSPPRYVYCSQQSHLYALQALN